MPNNRKVMFATGYFRGKAEDWVKPRTKAYLQNPNDHSVKAFFEDWITFKNHASRIFGISNEDKIAERRMQELRQTKSAAEYAAEFQRLSDRTEWDDSALQFMFRKGLKDEVKDEIMRHEYHTNEENEIDSLHGLMDIAIKIDNQLYERRIEKNPRRRGGYYPAQGGRRGTQQPTHWDPMELDATKRGKPGKAFNKSKKPKNGMRCYQCDKIGHIKRNCRQNQQTGPSQQLRATYRVSEEDFNHQLRRTGTPTIVRTFERVTPPPEDTETVVSTPGSTINNDDASSASQESEETSNRIMFKMQHHYIVQRLDSSLDIDWNETIAKNTIIHGEFDKSRCIKELDKNVFSTGDAPEAWMEVMRNSLAGRTNLKELETDITIRSPLDDKVEERANNTTWRLDNSHLAEPGSLYEGDPRHPHHGALHFTGCGDMGCSIHDRIKSNSDYYPKELRKCFRRNWNSCPEDNCAKHLIDKRFHRVFPGPGHLRLDLQRSMLLKDQKHVDCQQDAWQACIIHTCKKHYAVKRIHGFHPDDPDYRKNVHLLEKKGKAIAPASGADVRC